MSWLKKLTQQERPAPVFDHDAPDLEATLPASAAGRDLVRWSVAGDSFWKAAGGDRARAALTPELASVDVSPSEIQMAVAGRQDTSRDPPYVVWALKFGALRGKALEGPIPSSLAMDVMHVDANQGESWQYIRVADRQVLRGNDAMIRQDRHHRGRPYVYLTKTAIYALIADDEDWSEEVIAALPAT